MNLQKESIKLKVGLFALLRRLYQKLPKKATKKRN